MSVTVATDVMPASCGSLFIDRLSPTKITVRLSRRPDKASIRRRLSSEKWTPSSPTVSSRANPSTTFTLTIATSSPAQSGHSTDASIWGALRPFARIHFKLRAMKPEQMWFWRSASKPLASNQSKITLRTGESLSKSQFRGLTDGLKKPLRTRGLSTKEESVRA